MTPESRAEFNKILLGFAENFNISDFDSKTLHDKAFTHLDKALTSIEKIIIREKVNAVERSKSTAIRTANTGKYGKTQWVYNYNPLDLDRKFDEHLAELQSKLEGEL